MRTKLASVATAAALAVTGVTYIVTTPDSALAQEATTDTAVTAPEGRMKPPARGQIMEGVLGDLVDDGTITQGQADAITAAMQAKAAEIREKFPEGRQGRRGPGDRGVIKAMLEDGVIDADELASLGDGHPFNNPDGPAAQYLDDGQLTIDELQALREQFRANHPRPPGPSGVES
ncbi:hypothetical protein MNBD_ACTINO02-552 [hydrothermal vent metagenome]|uniref:Uncharacterized protein n=1 Tax=hydrothermal vent metagenome TaxID=652676 RepID=A0A3B0SCX7_9ZZZZ